MNSLLLFAALAVRIVSPQSDDPQGLLRPVQKRFADAPAIERERMFADKEFCRQMHAEGTTPAPVVLRWTVDDCQDAYPRAHVAVRRLPDGKPVFCGTSVTNAICVDNLELGRRYAWTVTVRSRGASAAADSEFVTDTTAPRLVRVDGVPNVRDIGGWIGRDGRRVRQGVIYRSAGWNDNARKGDRKGACRLTDESRAEVQATLGIVTDIDLRWSGERKGMEASPIGAGVRLVASDPALMSYVNITGNVSRTFLQRVLPIFLRPDPKDFPLVFHCIQGADRTGNLAYILGGLLGVDPDRLVCDYEFTEFSRKWVGGGGVDPKTGSPRRIPFDITREAIGTFPGSTENERIEGFVKSLGFTDADIGRFREFMLEPAPIAGMRPVCIPADGTIRLSYRPGEEAPVHVKDFGPEGAGGYAVFRVSSFCSGPHGAPPVLRLSYAVHPDGLGPTGCFTRETSADYLGVDNPVLPANINRHELYTIRRTGVYVAPLIQGFARYVRLQLDTPGEVEIESLEMENAGVYMPEDATGTFRCSDDRYNALWAASVRTCKMATFPDHNAWKKVAGFILPRKLEQGTADAWCRVCAPCDGTFSVEYEFDANPHFPVGSFEILTGERRLRVEQDATNAVRHVEVPVAKGERIGLSVRKESWPVIRRMSLRPSGKNEHEVPLMNLDDWAFSRTRPFISDGAKRDRLVWSGDLWWAQRMFGYAFAPELPYVLGSVELLAFNQTPEGYVHAAPYAENAVRPKRGEWGLFQSDEFSAWLIPVAWDWYLYSGDRAAAERIYPSVRADLEYLLGNLGKDGIFEQRVETSKHATHHFATGDTTHRAYMNILLWKCCTDAAAFAEALGRSSDAVRARVAAERLAAAIRVSFWDERRGCFIRALEWRVPGFEANALALAARFATQAEAERIAPHLQYHNHGKFQMLAARGKFEYGMTAAALDMLARHSWYALLDPAWKGTRTTYECMAMRTKGQGDEAHPDTAIGSLYANYLLGLEPMAPGWTRFRCRPQTDGKVTFAEGRMPTPHGFVSAKWTLRDDGRSLALSLTVPPHAVAEVAGRELASGNHEMTLPLDLESPAGRLARGVPAAPIQEGVEHFTWKASESREEHMWRISALDAPLSLKGIRGYSSCGSPTAETNLWLELDMGIDEAVKRIAIWPQIAYKAANGKAGGFPRTLKIEGAASSGGWKTLAEMGDIPQPALDEPLEVDLYTVVGYPVVRRLRFGVTRLGAPSTDHDDYRLQIRRIVIDRTVSD